MDKANNSYDNEQVFIIPFHNLQHIQDNFTYSNHVKDIWKRFDKLGKYVYHNEVEGKYEVQQLLSYVMIKNEDGNYLAYTHSNSNDTRTSNKMSIGFESHIFPEIAGYNEILFKTTANILIEKNLFSNITEPIKFTGFVRDLKSCPDHFGLVFKFKCNKEDVNIDEGMKWMTKDDLIANYHKFESWSKFIIDFMID